MMAQIAQDDTMAMIICGKKKKNGRSNFRLDANEEISYRDMQEHMEDYKHEKNTKIPKLGSFMVSL